MSYLRPENYRALVINAIDLDVDQILGYFQAEYRLAKDLNPKFKEFLLEIIQKYDAMLEKRIKEFQQVQQINPNEFSLEFLREQKKLNRQGIKNLQTAYNLFIKNPDLETAKEKINKSITKLKWNGQKNQLYNVLRQLKEAELIGNSFNSLADFLIDCVVEFQDNSKETIEKELKKKGELPKNRRVKIDLNKH